MSNEIPFRIGGVYRDKNGDLYELAPLESYDEFYREYHPNEAIASSFKVADFSSMRCAGSSGAHRLSDGVFLAVDGSDWDLLPGELHQVNGEWLPVEEKPTVTIGAILREKLEAQKRETPPFSVRVGATEKKRAPLTWNTATPFDPFKGFFNEWRETFDTGPMVEEDGRNSFQLSPDLSKATHQIPGKCGSAYLLKD